MLSSKLMEYVAVARVRASAQAQHEAQTTAEEGDGDNVVGVDKLDRTAGDGGVVRPETVETGESGDRPETVESCVPAPCGLSPPPRLTTHGDPRLSLLTRRADSRAPPWEKAQSYTIRRVSITDIFTDLPRAEWCQYRRAPLSTTPRLSIIAARQNTSYLGSPGRWGSGCSRAPHACRQYTYYMSLRTLTREKTRVPVRHAPKVPPLYFTLAPPTPIRRPTCQIATSTTSPCRL